MDKVEYSEILEGSSFLNVNNIEPEQLVEQISKLQMLINYPSALEAQIVLLRKKLDTIRDEKIDRLKSSKNILGKIKLQSKYREAYYDTEREIYTALARRRAELEVANKVAGMAKAKIKLINKILDESGVTLDGIIHN